MQAILCCIVCRTSGHTLYEVLELPQTATAEDIKRAYRKVLIMLYLYCTELRVVGSHH